MHSGGQFNAEPGSFSVNLYKELENYADAIIGNHPHMVQKLAHGEKGQPIAYSLGSLNMSQSSDYVNKENAPEFSIMLSFQLKKNEKGSVVIEKESFSLLHAQEDTKGYVQMRSWSIAEASTIEADRAKAVCERFCGQK